VEAAAGAGPAVVYSEAVAVEAPLVDTVGDVQAGVQAHWPCAASLCLQHYLAWGACVAQAGHRERRTPAELEDLESLAEVALMEDMSHSA